MKTLWDRPSAGPRRRPNVWNLLWCRSLGGNQAGKTGDQPGQTDCGDYAGYWRTLSFDETVPGMIRAQGRSTAKKKKGAWGGTVLPLLLHRSRKCTSGPSENRGAAQRLAGEMISVVQHVQC